MKLFNTMLLNVSSEEFNKKQKDKEIKNYLLMLWQKRKPWSKSKKLKGNNEEKRLLSSKNIISKLLVTKKPTKN